MATSKVERLVNLVIALLSTRGYITAEKIRSSVAGYSESASAEAFSRMFERDKNELRDLGIPLEVGRVSAWDPTEGYRINRDAYSLAPVDLTPDEAAAVAVATQLWESPELITATQGALLKLRAAGVDVDPDAPVAIASPVGVPGLRGSEDILGILLSAIDSRRAVQFPHRPSRAEPYATRTVEPWGVVTEKGRWYLVGHDRDRDATRTFRLSRIGPDVTPIGRRARSPCRKALTCAGSWPRRSPTLQRHRPAGWPRYGWPPGGPPRCAGPAGTSANGGWVSATAR
ncbi:protein pafB [Mycobacterium intracellulare 1956]|uniref:Protein pafB n=1 Tax=Mycobacterium intracellulare 1956 TaxID=1299331 RepID=X8CVG1_MYCIT|nr:protein pafB [Mycobacterium intracellulare 1956]